MSERKTVQTSLRIPKDLLKRLKHYAIEYDRTVAAVIHEAVEEYLTKRKF